MKTFIIESKVTRTETTEVKALNKRDALKFTENNSHLNWAKCDDEEQRELISIM